MRGWEDTKETMVGDNLPDEGAVSPLPVLKAAPARRDLHLSAEELAGRSRDLEQREAQLTGLESECRERVKEAEAMVADLQRQISELSGKLDKVALGATDQPPVPDNLLPFSPRRTAEIPVDELVTSLSRAADANQTLTTGADLAYDAHGKFVELQHDLQAAEDQIHVLEAELRKTRGQPIELPTSHAEIDPTVTDHISAELIAEGPPRFLALIDGDTEILHRLTRRMTIGRAADNDIQVEARFVSRYHAAVTAGPSQTVIEDLGSTNGLLVNGRRVARHMLRDGDVVRIGKSRFRFMTRPR